MSVAARTVHSKAAHDVGQRLRKFDGGLQSHDAVHVVHPQFHSHNTVGVAVHVQWPKFVDGKRVGGDVHHTVPHPCVATDDGAIFRRTCQQRCILQGERCLPSSIDNLRYRICAQRTVAKTDARKRQRFVATVTHRNVPLVNTAYGNMAIINAVGNKGNFRSKDGHLACGGGCIKRSTSSRGEQQLVQWQGIVTRLFAQNNLKVQQNAAVPAVWGERKRIGIDAQGVPQHNSRHLMAGSACGQQTGVRQIYQLFAQRNHSLHRHNRITVSKRKAERHGIARMSLDGGELQRVGGMNTVNRQQCQG